MSDREKLFWQRGVEKRMLPIRSVAQAKQLAAEILKLDDPKEKEALCNQVWERRGTRVLRIGRRIKKEVERALPQGARRSRT